MLYSRFPLGKPITQRIMQERNYGAVIAADPAKIWGSEGGQYRDTPNFSETDQQVKAANGLTIHIHPVASRHKAGEKNDYDRLSGRVAGMVMPVLGRYGSQVSAITIAQELCLCKQELWEEIVECYKAVRAVAPDLPLWIGDYSIRTERERGRILGRLKDLEGVVDGFVCVDYTDLSSNANNWAAQYMKVHGAGAVATRRFRYLPKFWQQLREIGIKRIALETAALSDVDSDTHRNAQTQIYESLSLMCDRHAADLWLWHLCDECNSVAWDKDRRVYAGVWDASGGERLNCLCVSSARALRRSSKPIYGG